MIVKKVIFIVLLLVLLAGCAPTEYYVTKSEKVGVINPEYSSGLIVVEPYSFRVAVIKWAQYVKGDASECLVPKIQEQVSSYVVVAKNQIPENLKNKPIVVEIKPQDASIRQNFWGTAFVCKIYTDVKKQDKNETEELVGKGESKSYEECFSLACENLAGKLKDYMEK